MRQSTRSTQRWWARCWQISIRIWQRCRSTQAIGWALWQRCESILAVTAAHYGRLRCPMCDTPFEREQAWEPDELLVCPRCAWRPPWARYHQRYRGKQLFGAKAVAHFEAHYRAFPMVRYPSPPHPLAGLLTGRQRRRRDRARF